MEGPACQGCVTLTVVVEQLRAEIAQMRAELATTKAQLAAANKNSSNSSKPPSSDIVKKPTPPPKGGERRKRGGQPGHPRHERTPFPDDQAHDRDLHCIECPTC